MSEKKIYSIQNNVTFFGRTAKTENCDAVYFNWSGSGFAFRFSGTAASVRLLSGVNGEEPREQDFIGYVGVYIDNIPYEISRFAVNQKDGWYVAVENIPHGEHTVYVVKETEAPHGRAAVLELECDGELLSPPVLPTKRIEFIGDSITCGYGNICSVNTSEFVTREENFSQTFAAVACRILGAVPTTVAVSGNGFFHTYDCNTHNIIPELYKYTDKFLHEHCGQKTEKWDFAKDKCDAVVVKLGQNDAQYCIGADLPTEDRTNEIIKKRRKQFCNAAEDFLRDIRKYRPNTPMILIYESDMYLKDEVMSAAEKSDCNIHLLEISPKRPHESVGANGHFSVYTHTRVGMIVAQKLTDILC